jgi:hypothetical protein
MTALSFLRAAFKPRMLVAVAAIVKQDEQPVALVCQGGARIARQFRWNLMRLDSREEVQSGVVRQAGAVLLNAARS